MSASAAYKQYVKRTEAEGRKPFDFETYKERYINRAPRGSKLTQPVRVENTQQAAIDALQAQLDALRNPAPEPTQQNSQTFEMRNPDGPATGRQLWKLADLGLITLRGHKGTITKAAASAAIDAAL